MSSYSSTALARWEGRFAARSGIAVASGDGLVRFCNQHGLLVEIARRKLRADGLVVALKPQSLSNASHLSVPRSAFFGRNSVSANRHQPSVRPKIKSSQRRGPWFPGAPADRPARATAGHV